MTLDSADSALEERPAAEVDRIRDIIFGPQMRLYEQQFKRHVGQLDLLGSQLEELRVALDQQMAAQEARLRQVQEAMQQRHTELERSLTSRLDQLEGKLEQQTTQIRAESRQALDQLRDEQAGRMAEQYAELKAELRQLATELRKQGQELRSEFTTALDAFDNHKASRHDVGDLLVEMGTRLKQQIGVADLLGQLGELAAEESTE